jgi:hypothetical protein
MAARLYLHVGGYKTATTTLPALCARERAWLRARGVVYPSMDPSATWASEALRRPSQNDVYVRSAPGETSGFAQDCLRNDLENPASACGQSGGSEDPLEGAPKGIKG